MSHLSTTFFYEPIIEKIDMPYYENPFWDFSNGGKKRKEESRLIPKIVCMQNDRLGHTVSTKQSIN
jgi:hypothetical protein